MSYRKLATILLAASLLFLASGAQADTMECDGSVIDVAPMGAGTAQAAPNDAYVVLQKQMDVSPDSIFKVFRPESVNDDSARQHPLKLYIGRLQIIDVQDEILIGRMIDFASSVVHPRVRYETIMIGDCLRLEPALTRIEVAPEELPAETLDVTGIEAPIAADVPMRRRVIPSKIRFKFDSSHIEKKWADELEQLAGFIATEKPAKVIVEGHACWIGPEQYNMGLSRRRARAVVDYLVSKHGLEKELFEVKAYGESRPEASNKTVEGRKKNRRGAVSLLFKVVPTVETSADVPSEWPLWLEPEELEPEDTEIPTIPAEPPITATPTPEP